MLSSTTVASVHCLMMLMTPFIFPMYTSPGFKFQPFSCTFFSDLGDINYGRKVKAQKRWRQPFHENVGSKLSDYIFRRIYEVTGSLFNKLHSILVPFEQIFCYIQLQFCNPSPFDHVFELLGFLVRVGESSSHGLQHWEIWRKDSVVSNIAKIICFNAKTGCVDETVLVDVGPVHVDIMLILLPAPPPPARPPARFIFFPWYAWLHCIRGRERHVL